MAWHFSAERHARQKRKGEAQEPYVNHLAGVAELMATATDYLVVPCVLLVEPLVVGNVWFRYIVVENRF